jgi:hypothetical protein
MELELVEPALYLRMDQGAANRFAHAIDRLTWHRRFHSESSNASKVLRNKRFVIACQRPSSLPRHSESFVSLSRCYVRQKFICSGWIASIHGR